jgi:hypothetical protein
MKRMILAIAGLTLAAGPTCAQQVSAPAGNIENGKTLYVQTVINAMAMRARVRR